MKLRKDLLKIGTGLFLTFCLTTITVQAADDFDESEDSGYKINLRLSNTPLSLAISSIILKTKFNVIIDPKIKGKVTMDLKQVPWEEGLDLILKTNNLAKRRIGKTLVIATKKTITDNFDEGLTKTYPLRYAKAKDIQGIITALLGQNANAKLNVQVEDRLNALIVSTTEGMFKRVDDLISKLDRPVPQVMLDVKIVEVSSNFSNNLGFKWNWSTGGEADGNIGEGAEGGGGILAYTEFQRTLENSNAYADTPQGSALTSFGDFYRKNLFFNAVFDALTTSSDNRTLASPRIIAMNGQKATLNIGEEFTFQTGADSPSQSKDTGTILNVIPQINNDGFIVLDLDLEKSTGKLTDGGRGLTVDKTSLKTTLQVHDNEEILVGGIVIETENKSETRIPFLSNLPFIKHLFISKSITPFSKEIVILITPKIVKQSIATTDFGELVADNGGGLPNSTSFNPTLDKPSTSFGGGGDDPTGGDEFGDDFGDDFGGL
ncbi:MAG: hypothetical protein COB02_05525 [Candidatus Cloacimonadota bacterium]|nr:MAG: hypothetical protein COB02_05525 [Candidatus Cloacimonadota bacterium]